MKGKIITGVVVVIILGLFWLLTTPLRANLTREKDILNFVNLKGFSNISKECKNELKEIQKLSQDDGSYDISDIITDYIIKCEGAVPYKEHHEPTYFKDNVYTENKDLSISKQGLGNNCSWLLDYITDYNLKHKDNFTNDLVENLEDKLDHRNKEVTKDWFINTQVASASAAVRNNAKKEYTIALPYGCYLEYQASKIIPLNRTYTEVKDWKQNKDNSYQVTLVDNNGKEYLCNIRFNNKGLIHKNDMTIDIYGIIVNYTQANVNLYSPDQIEIENSLDDTTYD